MVTTRRGPRPTVPQNDGSSSSDTNIAARPVRFRRAPAGTPATLRPPRDPNSAKRKQGDGITPDAQQRKRPRQRLGVKDTIEVQAEDDSVDKAIEVSNARFGPREPGRRLGNKIEIPLGSVGGRWTGAEVLTGPSIANTGGQRLRARRLNRHVNSIEVVEEPDKPQRRRRKPEQGSEITRETAQPTSRRPRAQDRSDTTNEETEEEEAAPTGSDHPDKPLGSPELQSSALKRRPARPARDVYDFPDDEESERHSPTAGRHLTTRNNPERLNPAKAARNSKRKRLPSPRRAGLSAIREEEQSGSASPIPPPRVARLGNDKSTEDGHWSEEDGESDGLGEPGGPEEVGETDETASNHVNIVIHPYTATQRTLSICSDHLNNMMAIMGKSGWAGSGRRWKAELLRWSTFVSGDEPPAHTRLGRHCFETLARLQDAMDDVPNALDLAGQLRFLGGQAQALTKAMGKVNTVVTEIEALPVPANSERRNQMGDGSRNALLNDLCSCVIPMIVLVVQSSFAIGVEAPDAEAGNPLPEQGVFTATTVQFVLWGTSWLLRLQKVVARRLEEEDSDSSQKQEPDNPRRNWRQFGVALRKWAEQLKHSLDGYNEQVDRDREIFELKRRDEAIKEARRKKSEEERARVHRQHQECWSSIQGVLRQPRPYVELWRQTTETHSLLAPSSQQLAPNNKQRSGPLSGTQTQTRSQDGSIYSASPSPWDSPPPPAPLAHRPGDTGGRTTAETVQQRRQTWNYPPWPEDYTEWFLEQLNKPDRDRDYLEVCADALERPLEEVRMEKERLGMLGLYRSPGKER